MVLIPDEDGPVPVIIPRSEHNLSRSFISENALKVLRRLHRSGYIGYLAGGGVRDILLGREPKDFDIATSATPEQIKSLFRNAILIGRRFRIAHIRFRNEIIEVATFRAVETPGKDKSDTVPDNSETVPDTNETSGPIEKKFSGKKLPEGRIRSDDGLILRDNVWGSPPEDAFRRDFTINALYYNIADFSIIDYVGGMADLMNGRIRLIGDPEIRYREDPVRMIRAVRFAAKLGFNIDETTFNSLISMKEHILKANSSRLYEELKKLWLSEEAEKGYQMMRSAGLFDILFPEVESWLCSEEAPHTLDRHDLSEQRHPPLIKDPVSLQQDNYPHTFIGKAFQWVEDEIRDGRTVSAPLLFAILLGPPIFNKAAELQKAAGAKHPVIFKAVKELLKNIQERVLIPKRDAEALKTILYGEQRFPQIKGKRPYIWIKNRYFNDAFRYFKMKREIYGEDKELIEWWEKFIISIKADPGKQQSRFRS